MKKSLLKELIKLVIRHSPQSNIKQNPPVFDYGNYKVNNDKMYRSFQSQEWFGDSDKSKLTKAFKLLADIYDVNIIFNNPATLVITDVMKSDLYDIVDDVKIIFDQYDIKYINYTMYKDVITISLELSDKLYYGQKTSIPSRPGKY